MFAKNDLDFNFKDSEGMSPKMFNMNLIDILKQNNLKIHKNSDKIFNDFASSFQSDLITQAVEEDASIEKKEILYKEFLNFSKQSSLEGSSLITLKTPSDIFNDDLSKEIKETNKTDIDINQEGKKVINQYIIQEFIGKGNFCKVKSALNSENNKIYAVKIANKNNLRKKFIIPKSNNNDSIASLQTEIAIMKKLNHPNIIQLYEVIDNPKKNKLYLIMEYAKKGAILSTQYCNLEIPPDFESSKGFNNGNIKFLSEAKTRKYTLQIISALDYLHNFVNIIHRDIKPDNILITEDDQAKLSDFGISYIIENGSDQLGNNLGTKTFLSPEAWEGKNYKGKPADIWAFGITIYYMLHGKVPFYDSNLIKLKEKIKNEKIIFKENISEIFKDLLNRILEKDPEKRITLQEILNHPWVNFSEGNINININNNKDFIITQNDVNQAITHIKLDTSANLLKKLMKIKKKAKKNIEDRKEH